MKVFILCDYFSDYGVSRASFKIRYLTAMKILEREHDVVFIYPNKKFKLTDSAAYDHISKKCMRSIGTPGLLPLKFRTGGFSFIDCLYKLYFVLTHPVDIIQVGSGHRPSNFIPSIVCKYLKGSIIIDECWEWLGQGGYADNRRGFFGKVISLYDKYLEVRLRSYFDIIFVISTELKIRFKNQEKVKVLFGGIENQTLRVYGLNEARDLLNISKDIFMIGMSNVQRSDHEDNKIFFNAFTKLCKKIPGIYLFATGTDEKYIDEVSYEFGVKDRIIFPGYIDFKDYNKYLSACNIFVIPYPNTQINRGRWPNKIGDFICLERPIITNPTGDIKSLFEKYKLGVLCDDTFDAYYNSVKTLINTIHKDIFIAEEARYVANNLLSFNARINKMLVLFNQALAKKKK